MVIIEKLNELYAEQAKGETSQEWRPRPSALGGCMREAAHILGGAEREPRTPESLRLLELGTQRGEELERRAKLAWPDAEVQVPVRIPVPWGVMDGTVDLWIPSLRCIVDFKTAGAYSMGLVIATPKRCDVCMGNGYMEIEREPWKVSCAECYGTGSIGKKEYNEGYALQLNAYRHGILHKNGLDLPGLYQATIRTILVYEAKDSDARKGVTAGMLHEVEVPYTEALENAYAARLEAWRVLLDLKASGSLQPLDISGMPKENGKPHWRCRMSKDNKPLYCSVGPIRGCCG